MIRVRNKSVDHLHIAHIAVGVKDNSTDKRSSSEEKKMHPSLSFSFIYSLCSSFALGDCNAANR